MNQMNLMVATMYRLVKSGASGDYLFFLCNPCNLLTTIVAHSGARTWCHAFAVVGVVLLAILADRQQPQTKYYRL